MALATFSPIAVPVGQCRHGKIGVFGSRSTRGFRNTVAASSSGHHFEPIAGLQFATGFMEPSTCPIPVCKLGAANSQGDIDEEDHHQLTRGCHDRRNGGRDSD
jgi:hypothetical protein